MIIFCSFHLLNIVNATHLSVFPRSPSPIHQDQKFNPTFISLDSRDTHFSFWDTRFNIFCWTKDEHFIQVWPNEITDLSLANIATHLDLSQRLSSASSPVKTVPLYVFKIVLVDGWVRVMEKGIFVNHTVLPSLRPRLQVFFNSSSDSFIMRGNDLSAISPINLSNTQAHWQRLPPAQLAEHKCCYNVPLLEQ